MKKKIIILLFVACLGGMLIFFYNDVKKTNKHLTVVATTSMLADAVCSIVGDRMIIHCLMGPGVDPHLYRARESDVHKLAAADLVIYNGLHLEGKMGQVLQGMNHFTHVLNVSNALDKNQLRGADFEELYDPHIWFNVQLWISVVRSIQQELMQLDSEHATVYKKNGDDYIAQLEQLDTYVKNRIAEIEPDHRILVTAHDAFGYFGDAYNFEVVGLQGLSTDCDVSTKDIQELADYIVKKQISTIFIESSISARSMRALQEAVIAQGWHITLGDELYSDALGDEASGADTYIKMVKYNVDTIVDMLKK